MGSGIVRSTVIRFAIVCLLYWCGTNLLPVSLVSNAGGVREQQPEIQKIDQALRNATENKLTGQDLISQILRDVNHTLSELDVIRTVAVSKDNSGKTIPLPDVCKSPTLEIPAPTPDPNHAMSPDTSKTAKKAKTEAQSVMAEGDYVKLAAITTENGTMLLDYLWKIDSEVEARVNFVAGICKGCKLLNADKRSLQQWLKSAKIDALDQRSQFDSYVRKLEQVKKSYKNYTKQKK
jgi:hypothetical protein